MYKYKMDMSKYEIPFLHLCIREFARRFNLSRRGAYFYLQKYAGLAFLIEYYDVEHLQSIDETLDDLVVMCRKNGGQLA